MQRRNLNLHLMQSWRVRPAELIEKKEYYLEEVRKFKPAQFDGSSVAPSTSDLWDVEKVPIALRGLVKRR